MRILHVISGLDPRHGGPTRALQSLLLAQRDAGLAPSLVASFCAGDDTTLADALQKQGIPVTLVGPCSRFLSRSPEIKPALSRLVPEAQVVHIHALWEEIQHQAARVAHSLRKSYLMRPCGMLDPWSLSQGAMKKKLYLALRLKRDLNRAAGIHYTDEVERDNALPLKVAAPAIIEPNIVDMSEFQSLPPPGAFRARYPQLASKPFVLFLSRVHPKKGLDLLIPAFAKVASDTGAVLVIAGPAEPAYQQELIELVKLQGVSERVIFTGMLHGRERLEALVDCQVFVLPSYQENFGVAVVEALAAGKPVVVSNQVAIHRHVTTHQLGAVVPTELESLSQALLQVLAMRDESLFDRARSFVAENYSADRIARRWVEHYRRIQSH